MRITAADDLARAAAGLAQADPALAGLLQRFAPLPLRLREPGFAALVDIITSQQISTAAAASIWARLRAAGLTAEPDVAAAGEPALTGCGLSRPKARHVLAIARFGVDWAGQAALDDAAARSQLLALPGVGPWTAEVYLLSALGRADAWPAGDLALQEAARLHLKLSARPDAAGMERLAAGWRPYRSVAARALWAYYRQARGRDGIR